VHHGREGGDRENVAGDFDGALFCRALDFLNSLGMGKRADVPDVLEDPARVGQQRLGVSAGARGAVLSLTRTLAKELGRQNITVNALALGWIETSHSDKEFIAKNRERILAFYPIRRLGKPEDVAPLVAFLASDLAGWVTGQTISVSGGYSTV